MVEAVRVRKEGFSYRPYFSEFVRDYRTTAFHFTDKVSPMRRNKCPFLGLVECQTIKRKLC